MTFNPIVFMREEIIPALRSGEYAQGRGKLLTPGYYDDDADQDIPNAWCCLGVMVDRLSLAGVIDGNWEGTRFVHGGGRRAEDGVLSERVRDLLGFPSTFGPEVDIYGSEESLAGHNDDGKSFDEIADALERWNEERYALQAGLGVGEG